MGSLHVVCLCADWCGTCRDYRAVFDELRRASPQHRYRWIDIEDEADFVGDVDIETFPTLLVAHAGAVLFAGPVLPRAADAQRLIESIDDTLRSGRKAAPLQIPAEQLTAFVALARKLG